MTRINPIYTIIVNTKLYDSVLLGRESCISYKYFKSSHFFSKLSYVAYLLDVVFIIRPFHYTPFTLMSKILTRKLNFAKQMCKNSNRCKWRRPIVLRTIRTIGYFILTKLIKISAPNFFFFSLIKK